MESTKKKWSIKENPILKTWKKMKSLGHMSNRNKKNKTPDPCSSPLPSSSYSAPSFAKSRSWHCSALQSDLHEEKKSPNDKRDRTAMFAPRGCFTVYVGPKKERFVVRTKLASHPMFKILLEGAEEEFGYRSEGPIVLPCEVDFFLKVLAEMESLDEEDEEDWNNNLPVCGLCSPYRSYGGGADSTAVKRYGSYKVLRTPPTFKLNSV
ncbi:PREDICTED: auxin-responsive protein SAUR36 [Tarenaya hassleriana]|uniref:auxin-responsive protein SAUR36 n=1 Tax=Tarenaya hassleriana TaxID=28532 RepID=UPI00053C5C33|nr:PREDICTED: auxin-responsive protein SAUR36 [Tarenaya hassleriana]